MVILLELSELKRQVNDKQSASQILVKTGNQTNVNRV